MKNTENEVWDLENLKLVLRFVHKDFSRYTLFIPLFKFSKSFLRLEEKFSRHLRLNYHPKRYELSKIANSVVSLICCGIERFVRLDDQFKVEKGLAKSLGFPKGFFSSRTAYRFFSSFNGWNINQLERINLQLLKEQEKHWHHKTGSFFIDLDMNTKSVEGKHIEKAALGYNRKHPGRLSLQWTVAHISKIALYSELHSGKTSGRTILKKQIKHIEKLLSQLDIDKTEQRLVWRVDGGYFSWDNLLFINKRRFITRVPKNLKALQQYWKDKHLKWKVFSKNTKYADLGSILFLDIELSLRVILLKVYRKKKVLLYALCSNLLEWTAKNIVKADRGRQIIEDCFRDTNQAFHSSKLPSSTFYGNVAFLWFIVLAYNQFFFFRNAHQRQKTQEAYTSKTFQKIS